MSKQYRAIISGVFIGLVGIALSFFFFDRENEAELLFRLRGPVPAPSEIIIIGIDKPSADALGLPNNVSEWPRTLHADLTGILSQEGAAVIGFDIFFNEPHAPEEDNLFAGVIRKAGNVVLCEYIRTDQSRLVDQRGKTIGYTNIATPVPPAPLIAQSSLASAPFPLPKVPFKVSRYWTFKTVAGDTPTFPVVAFQIFALDVYSGFIRLLKKHVPTGASPLPDNKDSLIDGGGIVNVVRTLRNIFQDHQGLADNMLDDLRHQQDISPKKKQALKSLINMYRSPDSQHLNFYGPARTIKTIPYHQVLGLNNSSEVEQLPDFRGKAVFIGRSEIVPSEKEDGHHTVFSQENGVNLSGVEIAATAFSNILHDSHIRPLPFYSYMGIILIWGLAVSLFCCRLPAMVSAASLTAAAVVYILFVRYQFEVGGRWYPLIVPVFFQAPFAVIASVIWKFIESKKFLHKEIVHKIDAGDDIKKLTSESRQFVGTCLITDIYESTKVSNILSAEAYSSLRRSYFDAIIKPLKQHRATISKTTGDGMLSAWDELQQPDSGRCACLAAVDIIKTLDIFNMDSGVRLQTRIGLHSGPVSLEVISATDHYEYDLGGNTVNTTKRIEESNKILGTRILLSDNVLLQLDGFLTRKVATFVLAGKSISLELHELICRSGECTENQRGLCEQFTEAYYLFKEKLWEKAFDKFTLIINSYGNDGPSLFYRDKCRYFRENPPSKAWEGEIYLQRR